MFSIIVNDVRYYDFDITAVKQYLQEQFKDIKFISFNILGRNVVFKYNNCFCRIDVKDMCHIGIAYDENEKSKIQPIVDCIKKWEFCTSKNGFIVECTIPQPFEFHMFNHYAHLNRYTIVCNGFEEKEYYIKHYEDCSIT